MNILITGAGGFLGRHVVRALRNVLPGAVLHGLDLPGIAQGDGLTVTHRCDLSNQAGTGAALSSARPRIVVHLAGLIHSRDREALYRANILGTMNLLTCLTEWPVDLVQISSSAIYGAPRFLPVTEAHPAAPGNPYGESMLMREDVAREWAGGTRARITVLRLFNLCGPGQAPLMMVPAFARQLALIEAGEQQPRMTVGRLDTRRELIDVRDVATAVAAAVTRHSTSPEEILNVCTGESVQIQEVLDRLLNISTCSPAIEKVDQEGRGNDVLDMRGDPAAIRRSLDWIPRFSLDETLRDVMDDWRRRIRQPVS